jgi:hypothetical protein
VNRLIFDIEVDSPAGGKWEDMQVRIGGAVGVGVNTPPRGPRRPGDTPTTLDHNRWADVIAAAAIAVGRIAAVNGPRLTQEDVLEVAGCGSGQARQALTCSGETDNPTD